MLSYMGMVVSQPPITEEALNKYAGMWVALRAGEVVAAAQDFDALTSDPKVERMDAVYLVPPASAQILDIRREPVGPSVPWGDRFNLSPAFSDKSAFLVGREDFFASFHVEFNPGSPLPTFSIAASAAE